jgi:hypothetical protein
MWGAPNVSSLPPLNLDMAGKSIFELDVGTPS